MNADRLLAHYERIADAPDAVARLRRLILDLAVRGKLVPQNPNDEPASELLKRIAVERAVLDKRKQEIRQESRKLPRASDAIRLPRGWAAAPLADLVKVLNGRAYKQNELLSSGTPVLRVGNLFTSSKWYYSDLRLEDDKYCDKGDLIFAWSASFGPFIWQGEKVIYHYHIWKLPLHSETNLDNLYLYKFLLQKTREIKEAGHGISMIHMTKEKMELIQVPLPPLAEQRRIVAKIDELMALCDRLEAARAHREAVRDRLTAASLAALNAPDPDSFQEDARFALNALSELTVRPDQIKQFRQTILNLAVRGKLVAQDQNDESASKLLKRLTDEVKLYAKENRITVSELQSVRPEEIPYPTPPGWIWTRLCALFKVVTDGDHQPPPKSDDGVAFLTIGNITTGQLDFSGCRFVPKSYYDSIQQYRIPKPNDILYTVVGATYGRPAPVATERPFCVQRHIAILRPAPELDQHFLISLLASPLIYEQATRSTTGTAQPTIALRPLRNFIVPLPPLAEQHRIVAKVDELMARCDRLEASLTAGDNTRRSLLDALLAEALAPVSGVMPEESERVAAHG
jgi:type I restriction enzyme, S subunit